MLYYYIGFLSIYLIFMLKKLNFTNMLRKIKQSDIFSHRSIATLFLLSKPLIFENKNLLSRTNLNGGNTND